MKYIFVSFILLLGLGSLFTACGLLADENEAALENVDAVKAMEIANQWKWTKKEIKSHVTTREVVFEFSNGRKKKIPLPEEKMLVAVAPYVNRTHRWTVHYMSSCQGELPEKTFYVKATDKDGNVLFSDNIATLRNGFFELWLPRHRSVSLSIKGMGRQVTGKIGTFDNSKTCVTTLKLR